MTENLALSRSLLESTLSLYSPRLLFPPRSRNFLAARFASEAALLLGFDDLSQQIQFATRCTPSSDPADATLESLWVNRTRDEIACDYPKIDAEYFAHHVDKYPDDDFAGAFQNANSDYDKECVLITQVMHCQVDSALQQSKLLPAGRMQNIHFIATMESYRVGNISEAKTLHKALPRGILCGWGKPQMALAVAGRAGWGGYPYPDY